MKSRLLYTGKNILWGYVNSMLTILLSFISRTVFLHTIGAGYLGINGLFSSVLGVLSLTELGIGTAMNYSLYKPVAENDYEKVKSLMQLYKNAYRCIAIVVATLGIVILPFLEYLIKGAKDIIHVELYYLIFLFNTVSSYFVSYKYSLINAEQKSYTITNITTIFNVVMNGIQIFALLFFRSYIAFLTVQALFQLAQKIYASKYIDRQYPYLKEKEILPLEKKEKDRIQNDVKALICHKIGEISVNQTDNIIISAFINVITVGIVSNYLLIASTVNSFVNVALNGTIGSLGNLIATADKNKQYKVFKAMDFVGFWIFGFSSVAMFALVQPFITLMWGNEYVLATEVVALIILNNYMVGQRISVNNIKVAGGLFEQDKYLAIIQSVVNLVVSIFFAKRIGLLGVYIGTIVSGFIPTFLRPCIVFKHLWQKSPLVYYIQYFFRLVIVGSVAIICKKLNMLVMVEVSWLYFGITVLLTAAIPNLVMFVLFRKTNEFKYLWNVAMKLCGNICRRGIR